MICVKLLQQGFKDTIKKKNYTEDMLAERLAYETVVRGIINRLNAARYDHVRLHPRLVDEWMHFVEANVAIPGKLKKVAKASGYEEGRHAMIDAIRHGLIDPDTDHPAPPQRKPKSEPFQAMSAREKDSRNVIAEIKVRATNQAKPSKLGARRGLEDEQSQSEPAEFTLGFMEPEAEQCYEPRAKVDILEGVGFGESASPVETTHMEPGSSLSAMPDPIPQPAHRAGGSASTEEGSSSHIASAANGIAADEAFEQLVRDRDSRPVAPQSYPIPLSAALDRFLEAEKRKHGDGRAESDVAPIINFMIDLIGDKTLNAVTRGDIRRVNEALPEIPTRKKPAPRACRQPLCAARRSK